jgi:hypothetical protein
MVDRTGSTPPPKISVASLLSGDPSPAARKPLPSTSIRPPNEPPLHHASSSSAGLWKGKFAQQSEETLEQPSASSTTVNKKREAGEFDTPAGLPEHVKKKSHTGTATSAIATNAGSSKQEKFDVSLDREAPDGAVLKNMFATHDVGKHLTVPMKQAVIDCYRSEQKEKPNQIISFADVERRFALAGVANFSNSNVIFKNLGIDTSRSYNQLRQLENPVATSSTTTGLDKIISALKTEKNLDAILKETGKTRDEVTAEMKIRLQGMFASVTIGKLGKHKSIQLTSQQEEEIKNQYRFERAKFPGELCQFASFHRDMKAIVGKNTPSIKTVVNILEKAGFKSTKTNEGNRAPKPE